VADEAARRRRPRRPALPTPSNRPRSAPPLPEGFPGELTPTLFRALTDNDGIRAGWMRGFNGSLGRWVDDLGLDACSWDDRGGTLQPGSTAPPMKVRSEVDDLADGWRRLVVHFELPVELADPPRLGVLWELPGELEHLEWFGEGPLDSYPDRRSAARLGRWRSTVSEQYVDYGMPQEHGHHGGLRWLALRGPVGGLMAVADGSPGFSARHHGDLELWRARHTHELVPLGSARSTYLSIDVAQRGLGQSSLGAEADERFRIGPGSHRLELLVRALGRREDPGDRYAHRPR
jgi:beta-galactosidase